MIRGAIGTFFILCLETTMKTNGKARDITLWTAR